MPDPGSFSEIRFVIDGSKVGGTGSSSFLLNRFFTGEGRLCLNKDVLEAFRALDEVILSVSSLSSSYLASGMAAESSVGVYFKRVCDLVYS